MDFKYEENRIYLEANDGKCIAEITFPSTSKNEVNINHTYVDTSLRGQGVANKLITALVDELKKTNRKTYATCSYAIDWFENHPEFNDIYLEDKK